MSRTYKNLDKKFSTKVESKVDRNTDILIPKQTREFNTVMQSDFNNGDLNPLHTPVLTQYLNIDTRFRDNLYSTSCSNFTLTLPATLKRVVSMQLSSYELPLAFYGISSSYGNNFLNISCTYQYPCKEKITTSQIIIIEDGNYAAVDLITKINSKLRVLNEDGTLKYLELSNENSIFNCIQLNLDININGSGNGKVTIFPSNDIGFVYADSIISIEMDFTKNIIGIFDTVSIIKKMGWNLGFLKSKYLGEKTYISDTLPDTASLRYIYLVVNDFNNSVNNIFVGAFNNSIINNNILARIPLNGPYYNIIMENDKSQHLEPRKYFGPVDIQRIQLQLLDDHGRVLDMNNSNFSISLALKTLYGN